MEDEEDLDEALHREVKEETGWEILSNNYFMFWADGETEHHLFRCEVGDSEPELGGPEAGDNSQENWFNLEWIDLNEVGKLKNLYPSIVYDIAAQMVSVG